MKKISKNKSIFMSEYYKVIKKYQKMKEFIILTSINIKIINHLTMCIHL